MKFHPIDVAASVCSFALVCGCVAMGIAEKPIPPELTTMLGASSTWLFIRGGVVLKDTESTGK